MRTASAALYETIQGLGLRYAEAPSSFESQGQKVRFPDQLLRDGLGCCLDLTLLFAGALEQMGFNPCVVLLRGHAVPAVWSIDDRFPEGIVEDPARLRNLIALGHLVTFDATAAVSASRPGFEVAVTEALRHLKEDAAFAGALDIGSLRLDGYRPLPGRDTQEPATEAAGVAPDDPSRDRIRRILEAAAAAEPEHPVRPTAHEASRFDKWKEKLLDLTFRNRLLQFKAESRSCIELLVPDLGAFEDRLAEGDTFEVLAASIEEAKALRAKNALDAAAEEQVRAKRTEDLQKRRLQSSFEVEPLWTRARQLERAARLDIEEGGANTLYVALGLLKWSEAEDAQVRFSPLLLYPLELKLERDRKRVRFSRLAEDPIGNVTLAEKLRRDCGVDLRALMQLEEDESGVDMRGLLQAVRAAIRGQTGWEVLEEAHIGLFTFTKFLMWKDLADNEPTLLSNDHVRHLAAKRPDNMPSFGAEVTPEQVASMDPAEVPCVVNADSTQMAAVASALSGRSFVLQGPPGTGKSQTIANLIAATLAKGRSVLFVSEKMAALEVVHRRLKEVGVEDFCLELHSHKSNKKEVLVSVGKAFDRRTRIPPPGWSDRSHAVVSARAPLDDYVAALHKQHLLGHSVFSASDRLRALRPAAELRLGLPVRELTRARLEDLTVEVDELAARLERVLPLDTHPFGGIGDVEWSMKLEDDLMDALAAAKNGAHELDERAAETARLVGADAAGPTARLASLAELARTVGDGPIEATQLDGADFDRLTAEVHGHAELVNRVEQQEAELSRRWTERLVEADLGSLVPLFRRWATAFFLFAFFALWSARKVLKAFARGALPGDPEIARDLETASAVAAGRPEVAKTRASLAARLTQPTRSLIEQATELDACLARSQRARALCLSLGAPMPVRSFEENERRELKERAAALSEALAGFDAAETRLMTLLGLRSRLWAGPSEPQHRAALVSQCEAFERARPKLRAWLHYRAQVRRLEAAGLGELVEQVRRTKLSPADVPPAFEKAVLRELVKAGRDGDPALRQFDAATHTQRLERFRQVDAKHLEAARDHVIHALEKQLPQHAFAPAGSEVDILGRELRKKARHMALRRLFATVPNLLRRLKPCLLMSPLSVAQYLPPDKRFDLLVFDEASQIGTHDAVGAIARANQVVVVGDSKQLPPTVFFMRSDDDDAQADDNDVVELESVLEEAVAKQFPQQMLGWHYRSRHHSLIEFSNQHYYGGGLHVFPSARAHVADLGIKWHPVPGGVYVSGIEGKTPRVNPKEAAALVAELVRSLRRYQPGERTFGVVTFNGPQQEFITNLLDEARAEHPEIEGHFQGLEHVFVKNLENVQGDERDEIFFSICYARDASGKLRMHFGPLSHSGGERRLNVAVTRARCQLQVFSTLRSEEIDLSKTRALGAQHLKDFLRRAERQPRATAAGAEAPNAGTSGGFAAEIAAELGARGFVTHSGVGSGGYRIDLAVVHPDRPGEYMLGIELDGPSYASARSARDRDRLRPEVLGGLGWKLHRVWTPEWSHDPDAQLRVLLNAVREAQTAPPQLPKMAEAVAAVTPPLAAPLGEPQLLQPPAGARPSLPVTEYRAAVLPRQDGDLYSAEAARRIRDCIAQVVEQEAPVHVDVLARRVGEAWGLRRVTDRLRERVRAGLTQVIAQGAARQRAEFVWAANQEPSTWGQFRGAGSGARERELEDIPIEEVANAAAAVLSAALSLPAGDLVRETGRLFGLARVSGEAQARIASGLHQLLTSSRAVEDGGRWVWKG
ncbi:MAG: DUF3320 domain-containing protein [Myxococcaceae bacterium]